MSIFYENIGWQVIEKLHDLILAEFPTSKVYKADLLNIPLYPDAGTFCIEVMRSDNEVEQTPMGHTQDKYTFNIWIYLRYVDKEEGQKDILDLAEHLETFLRCQGQIKVVDLWFDSDVISAEFGVKGKETERTITYLRTAMISWSCKVSRQREE